MKRRNFVRAVFYNVENTAGRAKKYSTSPNYYYPTAFKKPHFMKV